MKRQRIVITGMGGLCGLGTDAPAIWDAMRAGRSAIGPLTNGELHDLKIRIGAEIKQLPEHGIERKQLVSMDRFSLLAVIAAKEAMRQSGLVVDDEATTHRVGTIVGVGVCGWEAIEENYRAILLEGKKPRRHLHRAEGHAGCGRRPGQHEPWPARTGVRRHLRLLVVQPRLRHRDGPAAARPRRRDRCRRRRCAAGVGRDQGLGSLARRCA
jgi:hypothetical protein